VFHQGWSFGVGGRLRPTGSGRAPGRSYCWLEWCGHGGCNRARDGSCSGGVRRPLRPRDSQGGLFSGDWGGERPGGATWLPGKAGAFATP